MAELHSWQWIKVQSCSTCFWGVHALLCVHVCTVHGLPCWTGYTHLCCIHKIEFCWIICVLGTWQKGREIEGEGEEEEGRERRRQRGERERGRERGKERGRGGERMRKRERERGEEEEIYTMYMYHDSHTSKFSKYPAISLRVFPWRLLRSLSSRSTLSHNQCPHILVSTLP